MSKHSRDIELLRQIDNDLMAQYEELLWESLNNLTIVAHLDH